MFRGTTVFLRYVQRLTAARQGLVTDRELLERFAWRRDEEAFALLVERHGPMVLRVRRRVLASSHDAEDVFQATFVILARKARSVRWRDSVGNWLFGVAYNLARQARTAAARRVARPRPLARQAATDPLEELTARELLGALDEELASLPTKWREPLVLCFLEGLTRDEAALRLGIPPGTLRSRVERAQVELRRRLARRGLTLATAGLAALAGEGFAPAAVPATLAMRTVQLAVGGVGKASTVAGLVESGMQLLPAAQAKTVASWVAVVALALSAGAAACWVGLVEPQQSKPEVRPPPAVAVAAEPPKAKDLYGDPLPEGAVARLGTVRFRQDGNVTCLAVLPDGKRLVSASESNLYLWDMATGKQLHRLESKALPESLSVKLLTRDGRTAIGLGNQNHIVLWDLEGWCAQRRFAPSRWYGKAVLSPDGNTLALFRDSRYTVNDPENNGICLWDLQAGRQSHLLLGHTKTVQSVLFAPDGKILVSGADDFTLRFWDVSEGKEVRRVDTPSLSVRQQSLSPDGRTWATVGTRYEERKDANGAVVGEAWRAENKVDLRDWTSAKVVGQLEATGPKPAPLSGIDPYWITAMQFGPTGQTLLTTVADGTIREWDIAARRQLREWPVGMGVAMTLTPDGRTLVVGGIGNLSTWDLPTGKPRLSLKGHTGSITPFGSVVFAPRGGLLASSGYDRTIRIWEMATGNELHVLQGHEQTVTLMAFLDEGRTLLSAGFDNTIRFCDVASGNERRCLRDPGFGAGKCAVSPDGRHIVVCQGNDMLLLDSASGREVRKWTNPSKSYDSAMAFSPTGRELFLWRYDSGTLQVWDVETGRRLRQFPEDEPQGPPAGTARVVGWAVFSPDGRWLAVKRSPIAGVELIDVRTGRMVRQFKIPPGRNDSLAFSADSRTLATGQGTVDDGLILLWETTTGQERLHLSGARQGWINSLAFSPDCRTLASGGVDTTVLLWDVTGLRNKPNAAALSDGELQKNWHDVSEGDAAAAYRAMWTLTTVPQQALPLLRQALKPVPRISDDRIRRLISDLDSDTFAVRERAAKELESLSAAAEPLLRRELKANLTLESRKRIEHLLGRLDQQPLPGISLVECRALELLEQIGTSDAKQLLAKLAAGAPGATLTEEAKAALERLGKNPK